MQSRTILGVPGIIIIISILAFLSDLCNSATSPTVTLLAIKLGATGSFVGTMVAISSLSRLIIVQPVGILCDRKNPRYFLFLGFFLYIINFLFLIIATSPYHILIGRIIGGIGSAMFYTAAVTLILKTGGQKKGLFIGIYATLMGFGFTIGPMIGGQIAEKISYVASYLFSIGAASSALAITLFVIGKGSRIQISTEASKAPSSIGYRKLLQNKELLSICQGAFFISEAIGADTSFFPIFGKGLLLSEGTIGMILGLRALSSTIVRIPAGKLSDLFGSKRLLIGAMVLSAIGLFLVPQFRVVWLFPVFLSLEGIGYGVFLTTTNTRIGEISDEGQKGAAVGIYNTFSGIGGVLNMTILGFVADAFGVENTFRFTSLMVSTGIIVILVISWLQRRSSK